MLQIPLGHEGLGRCRIRTPAKSGNQPWTNVKPRGAVGTVATAKNARNPLDPPPPHPARGVAGEKKKMTVSHILNGLETMDLTGPDAAQAARMGFLEWAFCDREGGTPQAARAALDCPEARNASSDAARAFVGYLHEATQVFVRPTRRRARLLH